MLEIYRIEVILKFMGRPKEYQRENVVNQAMNLFMKKGYMGSSLSDLEEATGINKKSLYNEFGSKEGILKATIDNYTTIFNNDFRKLLDKDPYGVENIFNFFNFYSCFIENNNQEYCGCLILNLIAEKDYLNEDLFESGVVEFTNQLKKLFSKNLMEFEPKIRSEITDSIFVHFLGYVALAKSDPHHERVNRILDDVNKLIYGKVPH